MACGYDPSLVSAPLGSLLKRFPATLVPEYPGRVVVPPPLRAVVLAGMAQHLDRPILAVVPGEREAEDLVDDLGLFTTEALHLPAWETLPFEHVSPAVTTMAHRTEARHRLQLGAPGLIVVASVRAVSQRVSTSPVEPLLIESGTEVGFDLLVTSLAMAGYHRTDRVESRGEFAVRGGIVDVFPAQGEEPFRIEFWGDEVEEIRAFTVGSQRSTESVDQVVAYPPRELRIDDDSRTRRGAAGHRTVVGHDLGSVRRGAGLCRHGVVAPVAGSGSVAVGRRR